MDDNNFIYERSRVLMAYQLRIPPDDLNIDPIFQSVFRAIRESCENKSGEIVLTIKNEEEEKAILQENGQKIITMIFENQYPFEGIVEQYQTWYVSNVLDNIDNKEW